METHAACTLWPYGSLTWRTDSGIREVHNVLLFLTLFSRSCIYFSLALFLASKSKGRIILFSAGNGRTLTGYAHETARLAWLAPAEEEWKPHGNEPGSGEDGC